MGGTIFLITISLLEIHSYFIVHFWILFAIKTIFFILLTKRYRHIYKELLVI